MPFGGEAKIKTFIINSRKSLYFVETPNVNQKIMHPTPEAAAEAWNAGATYNPDTHTLISNEVMRAWRRYMSDMRPEPRNDFLRTFKKSTEGFNQCY